jgi:hypothetical protein
MPMTFIARNEKAARLQLFDFKYDTRMRGYKLISKKPTKHQPIIPQ